MKEVIEPTKKQMEKELKNCLTATPESALRPAGNEKKKLRSSGGYAFSKSEDTSNSHTLSHAMCAIDVLMLSITGKSILRDIN